MTKAHSYLAGGALAILMSSASALAMPANSTSPQLSSASRAAIILAQAEPEAEQQEGEPRRPRRERQAEQPAEAQGEATPRRQRQAEQPAEAPEEAKPRRQRQAEQPAEAPAEATPRRQRQAEQPAEAPEEATPRRQRQAEQPAEAPEEAKPRRQRQAEQPAEQAEQPQAEQPAEAPAEARPRRQRQAEQPAVQGEQPAKQAEQPQAEQPAEAPAEPRPRRQRQAEQPNAEQPAEAPAEARPRRERRGEQPAEQAEQPNAEQPNPEQPAEARPPRQPAEQPADQAEQPRPDRPADQAEQPSRDRPSETGEAAPMDGGRAPMLDSAKPAEERGGRRRPGRDRQPKGEQTAQPPVVPAGPPPADDRAAQEAAQPREIVPVTRERGERRRERPRIEDRERPEGSEVVRRLGDRIILNFNDRTIVESDERERLGRGARDVYYEDLPRGQVREVIERPNGSKVITIRDRSGDVIRRSRITPDGREVVLVYVDEQNYDRVREWRDPGDDLPPMQLDIPEDEYILDSERVENPDDYYEFLSEPPVERVERLYSIDEVKRSARIRDKTRRIDLDSITFEFGKSDVPENQVTKLEGVAQAMTKMLEKNPAESFLIEGHTDAVGTDEANLALSDRRAEAVASALSDVFGVPPENLTTQGYGEEYLKVRTPEPERENRRVAIRRVTPLVAPVASAQ